MSSKKSVKYLNSEILKSLYDKIEKVDFRTESGLSETNDRLSQKHYLVTTVLKVMEIAKANEMDLCSSHGKVYIFNGEWWSGIEASEFRTFLGEAAVKMGVEKFTAMHYTFREHLIRQFLSISSVTKSHDPEAVMINLKNGTLVVKGTKLGVKKPDPNDFITYQLPFELDTEAFCPIFLDYLNRVLPNEKHQDIISEYLGYLFMKTSTMKLEKALLLYGTGANGKSVLFDIVNALLGGSNNVSNHSLQNLTNENGYYRAMIGDKLVNYASEVNGHMDTSMFKKLVSGEPVDARLPYCEPFILTDYAKLIFNCNELPTSVENTNAFYRRFLIIPFEVTIPEEEQDKQLAQKIIKNELSGVFNWVLCGIFRLIKQKNFTQCESVDEMLKQYKYENNTLALFFDDMEYEESLEETTRLIDLYNEYKTYCLNANYRPLTYRKFSQELRNHGISTVRRNYGIVAYCQKTIF